ncbi:hypothetical protein JYQ62_14225 [Nostoc sp. UHCC 0702]|nr:hypothetical protein JYQ62_14225 [Nostoc sp. UHCC 0702]
MQGAGEMRGWGDGEIGGWGAMPHAQYFGFAQYKFPIPNSQFPIPNSLF